MISEADTDISISRARFFLKKNKQDFKTICFSKNQKIPGRNSTRKLQNMIKRKNDSDEIKYILLKHVLTNS